MFSPWLRPGDGVTESADDVSPGLRLRGDRVQQGLGMGEDPLITAVRSGDENAVRILLEDGADPDVVDGQGTSALCLAISAFNSTIASYLVEGGADPDRRLPDGTTPRLRAVDSGSIGLADCLLGGAAFISEATRAELLARARQWHEMGPVAVLRERTGASDVVERVRIRDTEWSTEYHELGFGGMTIRDGHTGILTLLEKHFGLHLGFDELAARACALELPGLGARRLVGDRQNPCPEAG